MPYNAQYDLRGKRIEDTYSQLSQYDTASGASYTGQGSSIPFSASYTPNADTSSYSFTASYALNASLISGSALSSSYSSFAQSAQSASFSPIQLPDVTDNVINHNVGFNQTNPQYTVDVNGSIGASHYGNSNYITLDNGLGNMIINTDNSSITLHGSNTFVGVNNNNPSYNLDVSGSVNFTTNLLQNGSIYVPITASYALTSSVAKQAISASYVSTSSISNTSVSSSFSTTTNTALNLNYNQGGAMVKTIGSGLSLLDNGAASMGVTGGGITIIENVSTTLPFTLNNSNNQVIATIDKSGSFVTTGYISSSAFLGTASYASQSLSASFALSASWSPASNSSLSASFASSSISASFLNGPHTGSTFGTASWANNSLFAISASYAVSASNTIVNSYNVSSSFASSSFVSISSSFASASISASYAISASWSPASNSSLSASFASSSISASYSTTASFSINASLSVTSSFANTSISSSFFTNSIARYYGCRWSQSRYQSNKSTICQRVGFNWCSW